MRVLMGCDNFIRRESGRGGGVSDVRREASGARWSVTGGILYLPLSAFIRSLRPHAPTHHQHPPPPPPGGDGSSSRCLHDNCGARA